jgi:Ca2+-binding EF-hand superfamily protein
MVNEEAKAEVVQTIGQIVRKNTLQEGSNKSAMQADLERMKSLKRAKEDPQIAEARKQALEQAGAEFDKLDLDKSGYVNRDELVKFSQSQSMASSMDSLPEADKAKAYAALDSMIAQFDADGDGKVTRSEWNYFFNRVFESAFAQAMAEQQ